MTRNALDTTGDPATSEDRLQPHDVGHGYTAWRLQHKDAPGLYALIYDGTATAIPVDPENGTLTIGVCAEGVEDPLFSVEIDSRAGLNRWYAASVGYEPDKELGGPLPVQELIVDTVTHIILRRATPEHD